MAYIPKSARKIESNAYMPKSARPIQQEPQQNLFQRISGAILPATERLGAQIGTGYGLRGEDQRQAEQSIGQANEMTRILTERLKTETDPATRELIAKTLRESSANISDIAQGNVASAQQATGIGPEATSSKTFLGRLTDPELLRTGAGFGLEVGSLLVPQGQSDTPLGRIGRAGLQGAGAGTLAGASKATREADTWGEAAKQTALGSLIGAGTGAAFQFGIEGAGFLGEKAQEGFRKAADKLREKGYGSYANTFKENKTAQRIIDRRGGPEKLAKEMIDENIPKTKGGVQKEVRKLNNQYEQEITKKLKTLGKTRSVDVDSVLDDLIKEGEKIYDLPTPQNQRDLQNYKAFIESFRGQYPGQKANLNNINELRKKLDQAYAGVNPSNVVDGEKLANDMLANKLRQSVQDKAPLTKSFFNRYSLLKTAEQIFYKEPKTGIVEATIAAASPGTGAMNILEFLGGKAFRSPGVARALSSVPSMGRTNTGVLPIPEPNISQQAVQKTSKLINPSVAALQRLIDKENKVKQGRQSLP